MMNIAVAARRAAPVTAIALGLVTFGIGMATVPLDSLIHQAGTGGPLADTLTNAAAVVPATAVGTLLAARRPRNPIGWLTLGIIIVGFGPTGQYLMLDYRVHHGTLPLGGAVVILQECWPLFLLFISILLWVFPDGTLPLGRWHRPSVAILVAGLVLALAASTSDGLLIVVEHHVRIKANGDLANTPTGALAVLNVLVIAGALLSWLAWLAFQVTAYRHASGERRQQLKWLYSGAAILVVSLVIGVFIVPLAAGQAPGWGTQPLVGALTTIGTGALPVCLGVAVLKYRLYELNRIISRVVSYTLITALLAGVFFGLVLLATHVLPFRTPVAVAAATLVIAALFNPLRRRVQQVVDRRFNRARYDAEAVVAAFSTRLRQSVDLDTVRDDLVGTVHQAFQPSHISVWLPSGTYVERPRPRTGSSSGGQQTSPRTAGPQPPGPGAARILGAAARVASAGTFGQGEQALAG